MKRIRRVTEAEAISDFLKNEFYRAEFDHDREQFESLVMNANITDDAQNALRRALLFRRRGHMWRELPDDTQWWEVEIEAEDIARIQVFPRAQWRRLADSSFALPDIVERIRKTPKGPDGLAAKIQLIRYRLQSGEGRSTVLLIGVDERRPLTILEGNHRLAAALMTSREMACSHFRLLCGFSLRMTESVWYVTNIPNLWRYLKNRLRNLYDKDADVGRLTEPAPALKAQPRYLGAMASQAPESK